MRTVFDNKLSREQIKIIGLAGNVKSVNDAGFIDFEESKNPIFKNYYLDLENVGTLTSTNPKLVTRDIANVGFGFESAKTYRTATEKDYFYTKYKIYDYPAGGNISFLNLSQQTYNAEDNNFFKPFKLSKIKKTSTNDFKPVRLRFSKDISNTKTLTILTPSGELNVTPAGKGSETSPETKKRYYTYNNNFSTIPSGSLESQGIEPNYFSENSGLFASGYYIPYPTTLDIQNYYPYNIPVQIAPKFNSNNDIRVKGLLAISIGSASKKEIVYISPHSMSTGIYNTPEQFNKYSEKIINLYPGSKKQYLTLSGAGYDLANGIYKEVISHPSSGYLPRYRNKMPSGVKWSGNNPNIPKKEIYWDNYKWNIDVDGSTFYTSPSQISVSMNSRNTIPGTFTEIEEMIGTYTEVYNPQNNISRAWVKDISVSGRFNPYRKSVLFWDPTQSKLPIFNSRSEFFVSVIPNHYAQSPYTGTIFTVNNIPQNENSNELAQYFTGYQRFLKTGSRSLTRGPIQPKFFDGWHLPQNSGNPPTFLNSWILPYKSGQVELATGNFITQGRYVVSGATFWSGIGFQYVTGKFYDSNGQLFSGQVISGEGVEYLNETKYRTVTNYVPGIITGYNVQYLLPSNWTTGFRYVTGYSGLNGSVSLSSGNFSQPFVSGQIYWYPQNYRDARGEGIPISLSGVEVINGVVYVSGVSYSGYPSGNVAVTSVQEYLQTICISGTYRKRSSDIYVSVSNPDNLLLYDTFGDYGFKDQWILINETNSYVTGATGYTTLFINKKTPLSINRNVIPRVCWWDGHGFFSGSGLHINETPTPIIGGYSIARIPEVNSEFKINTRNFLNLLSLSENPYFPEVPINYPDFFRASRMIYTPTGQIGLNPSNSVIPRNISWPLKTQEDQIGVLNNAKDHWYQEQKITPSFPFGYKTRKELFARPFGGQIGNTKLWDMPYWISAVSGIDFDGPITYAPAPIISNGAFYKKAILRKENKLLQVKTINLDSSYLNNGKILPSGYVLQSQTLPFFEYPEYTTIIDENSEEVGINTDISGLQIESGFIINGEYVPYETVIENQINIPVSEQTFSSGLIVENINQKIPLKDTLFYKLYNNLYTGSKILATGTWDGIIPSGAYFSVELISTHFDDNFGIDSNNIGVFYAGEDVAVKDRIDQSFSLSSISGAYPKVKIENNQISYNAYAISKDNHISKMKAKNLARKKLQIIYNKAAKENFEEILYKNSNYNKMQNFLTNKEASNLFTGYISPFNDFDTQKYIN